MEINSTKNLKSVKETNKSSQATKEQEQDENVKSFSDEYKELLDNQNVSGSNTLADISYVSNTFNETENNIKSSFNYNTLTISKDDAMFFNDLVDQEEFVVADIKQGNTATTDILKISNTNNTKELKSQELSQTLIQMLEDTYKTNKPVRIDFDNNVSVILRTNKEGKLSAEFIPSDKAVEEYLRQNIGYLKKSFDEQNLPYSDIMYKPYNNSKKKQEQRNNKS